MTYILKTTNICGTVDYIPYRSLYKALAMSKALNERTVTDAEVFLLDKQAGLTPIVP